MHPAYNFLALSLVISLICDDAKSMAEPQPSQTSSLPSNSTISISKPKVPIKKELLALKSNEQKNLKNIAQLAWQGKKSYAEGKYTQAVKNWLIAAETFQSQNKPLLQAQALNYLSLAYQQLGAYSQAHQAIANSLNILKTQEQKKSSEQLKILAQALNVQGQVQMAQGQTEEALATWKESETIYAKIHNFEGKLGSLINQAQALQVLGFDLQAIETLKKVTQELQEQPDNQLKIVALHSLGNTLRIVGDLDKSQKILQQNLSLALAQKTKSSQPEVADILLSLGNTARAQQDYQAALSYYQQAASSSTNKTRQTQAQLNQLSLLLKTKQLKAAQTMLPQLSAKINELPPSRTTIYAQINYAQSLKQLKMAGSTVLPSWADVVQILAKALRQAKKLKDTRAESYALGTLGSIYEQNQQWVDARKLTEQALTLAQTSNASDINYRWQWQLGRLLRAQGNTNGAIASYTQAVDTLKSLRNDLVAINPEVQFDFRDEVEPVYRQLVELLLDSEKPSQKNLIAARNTIESLQLAELDNYFKTACLEGKPVQIDQVIDQQDKTAAVIYPIILQDRLEVIVKLPEQPLQHYRTRITQTQVEDLLKKLQQQMTEPFGLPETRSLSRQVYNWLLQPIQASLVENKTKTLVFVLDGALRNIPMATLYNGKQYLIENYAVALTPGLQMLPPQSIEQVKLEALTAGLTEARKGFSALSNVGLELKQINSEVPSTTLLNQKFTSTALSKQLDEDPFPVVHLATHGQFSSQASETFVLAWDKPIVVNDLSNMLRSRSQRDALELLVLSACETAAGDQRAALGLAGVAVRAGARSTLASLWQVDDKSSASLMSQFYQEVTNNKVSKAEALRRAQLQLLQSDRYSNPIFWGSFVLVGNWL